MGWRLQPFLFPLGAALKDRGGNETAKVAERGDEDSGAGHGKHTASGETTKKQVWSVAGHKRGLCDRGENPRLEGRCERAQSGQQKEELERH